MEATSTAEPRRQRQRRHEEPETQEPEAPEAQSAAGDEGDPLLAGEGAEEAQKKRRRQRRPDGIEVRTKLSWKVKLAVYLTAPTLWRLKHLVADSPGLTEADIVEALLVEHLKNFDFPRRPDWLLRLEEEERRRREAKEVSVN